MASSGWLLKALKNDMTWRKFSEISVYQNEWLKALVLQNIPTPLLTSSLITPWNIAQEDEKVVSKKGLMRKGVFLA